MATAPRIKRYISLSDAAEVFDVSEKTLRRMISSGELTGYRFGKRLIRLDNDELAASLRPIPTAKVVA